MSLGIIVRDARRRFVKKTVQEMDVVRLPVSDMIQTSQTDSVRQRGDEEEGRILVRTEWWKKTQLRRKLLYKQKHK